MNNAFKHFVAVIIGRLSLYYYIFFYGSYKGRQLVYRRLQSSSEGLVDRSLRYVIEDPFGGVVNALRADFQFYKNNINHARLTSRVIEQYSTDDLMGYGEYAYDKGGHDVYDQLRGYLLPMLESFLAGQNGKSVTLCELGTGNGDIVAHLAKKFPQHKFMGVDFSVAMAESKHQLDNLSFVKGYGLDLLTQKKITPDIIIASSTMCLFTPLELEAYLENAPSVKDFFVNEPSWAGLKIGENQSVRSEHLEGALWFHNYTDYFKNSGYRTIAAEASPYKHSKSARPDIVMNLAHFSR